MQISGQIVDIHQRKVFPGTLQIENGRIKSIEPAEVSGPYILPGFIDAHVHVESSMLVPSAFARLAVIQGTVGTVSDPHEIGNVLGLPGIQFMIENGRQVPFHFAFGAPSCVPATGFETAGAVISSAEIRRLFETEGLKYLSEMMNFPGVLHADPEVMAKIAIAKSLGRPVDGHAPGLRGEQAERYIAAGISTDHECFVYEEALEKLNLGMKILIREGSAAKNYDALHPIIQSHPERVMFCTDDAHPDTLVAGHINALVRRSVAKGYDLFNVLRCACYNPIVHYGLEIGCLRTGDSADFIVVEDLQDFRILQTYISGQLVASEGKSLIKQIPVTPLNRFDAQPKKAADFRLPAKGTNIRLIHALDGQLITEPRTASAKVVEGAAVADPERDLLKLAVVNRYADVPPAIAFISGFGLQRGAIASSVAHDSHNVIAVGTSDEALCAAVNAVIRAKGGIACVDGDQVHLLPLPIAGLMSAEDGWKVAEQYSSLDAAAKALGSPLHAPFMTLAFMALLVIPSLKLSDKGLFDGNTFQFTELFD